MNTGILQTICTHTRERVHQAKAQCPDEALMRMAKDAPAPRGFRRAIEAARAAGHYGLIAEIKKASPSRGLIRKDFIPDALAQAYAQGGAACLSVLTEPHWFEGNADYLRLARGATSLPVLRKDFMLDIWQVAEARHMGADCILLIMAAIEDDLAQAMSTRATALGMDVLVEVHNRQELERALALPVLESPHGLLGINNRDLKTLTIDLATTENLLSHIPAGHPCRALTVSESGLYTPAELARIHRAGVGCFLIGESLMRQEDVCAATRALLQSSPIESQGKGNDHE